MVKYNKFKILVKIAEFAYFKKYRWITLTLS